MKGITNKKITRILDEMIASKLVNVEIDNTAGAFMSFNIDYLGKFQVKGLSGYHNFAFSHYYKDSSGDMIADPDMQVIYAPDNNLYPYTYQDSFGFQESFNPQTGELKPILQKEHAVFLSEWLKNVVQQQGL